MENAQNADNTLTASTGASFAILAAIMGSVLFSGKGILAKAGMAHGASSMDMLALRMAFASPIYATVLFWSLRRNPVAIPQLIKAALLGLLGCYLSPTLNFYGLSSVSASLERILIHACPALIIMVAWLKGRERLNASTIAALLVCYSGVAISCLGRDGHNASASGLGVSAILIGCVTWSLFVVESAEMQKHIGTLVFTSTAMLTSALACCVQNIAMGNMNSIIHPSDGVLPIAIALAIFCTALPAYMTSYGLRKLGPGKSAILSMFGPLLTPVFAGVILQERMSGLQIGGFAIVFLGGILLTRRNHKPNQVRSTC